MIIEFHVKNFRSFKSEQVVSCVASNYDKSLPENLINPQLPGLPDLRLVKALALYGPNAGGKTNVLVALWFLKWLVLESATGQKAGAALPRESFRLDKESSSLPTVLELTFVAENIRYEFAVAVTRERIVQERLVAYPSGRSQVWYDRVWDAETKRHEWSPTQSSDFKIDKGIVEKTRENALFLSTAAQWNNAQVTPVFKWFDEHLHFLNLSAEAVLEHSFTAKMVSESEDMKQLFGRLLRTADLGLVGVETKEVQSELDGLLKALAVPARKKEEEILPRKIWQVNFNHEGKGGTVVSLDMDHESAGTCRFFSLLGPWLDLIRCGHVVCVDELDTSLHPTLVEELLRLLFQTTKNCPGAQVLFTTHNPLLLNMQLLRRDQIWFADKDKEGASFLYPLTDYRPRADESLIRGYLSGRYGAVPFIPSGLVSEEAANQGKEAGKPEAVHAG